MAYDVVVVGAGPAGLTIAEALASRGLNVACLDEEHPREWPNNYGVWEDRIAHLELHEAYDCVFETPVVFVGDGARPLDRTYVRLDNEALRQSLYDGCDEHGVTWIQSAADHLEHHNGVTTVTDTREDEHTARLIIDATGHRPVFVERVGEARPAFQAAYGFVAEFAESPIGDHDMVLMDYRADYDDDLDDDPRATFLYAMRLDDERIFVEETSLAGRPPMTFDVCEERLASRLRNRGTDVTMVHEVERCLIPMGVSLPDLEQRVVGFGAAASMVHPATGYQMARMLETAPRLADTIARELASGGGRTDDVARAAWQTIWPADEVRARQFWLFGMEALLDLDAGQTRQFFSKFFDLPHQDWSSYMSGTLSSDEIPRVMWNLFKRGSGGLKWSLARSSFGTSGLGMLRTALGG